MSDAFSSSPVVGADAKGVGARSSVGGSRRGDLRGPRSRHQQLPPPDRPPDRGRVPGGGRLFAHRPPRRGVVADRAARRRRDRADPRRPAHLPGQDGRARRHPRPQHRDRSLPRGRQRPGVRRQGARRDRRRARDRRPRDRGPSRRRRRRRPRRPRGQVDRDVRHRRRLVGNHLARGRSALAPAPCAGLGIRCGSASCRSPRCSAAST